MNAARHQIGCALLADGGIAERGIASVEGKEAFSFPNLAALQKRHPEVVWVTSAGSLPSTEQPFPWLRSTHYLPTSLQCIAEEIGVPITAPKQAAPQLSEILARMLTTARGYCRLDFPGSQSLTFAEVIRQGLAPNEDHDTNEPNVRSVLQAAAAGHTTVLRLARGNDVLIRLPMQRIPHVADVLAQPVPLGNWTEINLRTAKDPLMMACEGEAPTLALVRIGRPIAGSERAFPKLMPKQTGNGDRRWLAQPELKAIAPHAAVVVERLLVSERDPGALGAPTIPFPEFACVEYASISSGSFAEAFLTALFGLGVSAPAKETSEAPIAQPANNVVSMAVWLLSEARARVFAEVVALARVGVPIVQYNGMHVVVAVKRASVGRLRKVVARSEHLLWPARYSAKWLAKV